MESPSVYGEHGENGLYEMIGKENESIIDLYKLTTIEDEEEKQPQIDEKFVSYIYSMDEEQAQSGKTLETMNPKIYQLFQVIET